MSYFETKKGGPFKRGDPRSIYTLGVESETFPAMADSDINQIKKDIENLKTELQRLEGSSDGDVGSVSIHFDSITMVYISPSY